MLTGIGSATFLIPTTVSAADLSYKAAPPPAAYAPAVDGFNAKFGGLGGSLANHAIYGAQGSVSVPLAGQYGFQLDGSAGGFDGRAFAATGAHLFWRNPTQGLIGVYGSYTHWDQFSGLHVGQIAGEAEAYFGPFTVQAIAGVESGNSASRIVGNFIQTYDIETRFFDKVNLGYYLNDNLKVFVGHRYLGGKHALALGGEWGFSINGPVMGALFVEARLGEHNFEGIWGGLRFYYGQKDKTLIQRHRQDDPINWLPETLFSIVNTLRTAPIPAISIGAPVGCPDGDFDGDGDCLVGGT
jgi:hypothetical protein